MSAKGASEEKQFFSRGVNLLTSTPEIPVELLLYSLNERGVEKTRSQKEKALFAPAASLKDEENAARAPKERAK